MSCEQKNGILVKQEWNTFAFISHGVPVMMGKRWVSYIDLIKAAAAVFGVPRNHVVLVHDQCLTFEFDGNHRVEISSGDWFEKVYQFSGVSNTRDKLRDEIAQLELDKMWSSCNFDNQDGDVWEHGEPESNFCQ